MNLTTFAFRHGRPTVDVFPLVERIVSQARGQGRAPPSVFAAGRWAGFVTRPDEAVVVASALSREFGYSLVVGADEGGSVFAMSLFGDGTIIDVFAPWLVVPFAPGVKRDVGDPTRWAPVLAPRVEAAALRDIWDEAIARREDVFDALRRGYATETPFARALALLAIPPRACPCGAVPRERGSFAAAAHVQRHLGAEGGEDALLFGEPFEIRLPLSPGGARALALAGSAVSRGLVAFDSAAVVSSTSSEALSTPARSPDGREVVIRADVFARPLLGLEGSPLLVVVGRALAHAGRGSLTVRDAGREGDPFWSTRVRVRCWPPRRPFGAWCSDAACVSMGDATTLVAAVTLACDDEEAARLVPRASGQWSSFAIEELGGRPSPAGDAFGAGAAVRAEGGPALPRSSGPGGGAPPADLAGADVVDRRGRARGGWLAARVAGEAGPAWHLAFWAALDGLDEALIARARSLLTMILDDAAASAGGLQGFLAEWDWRPATRERPPVPWPTPYEQAFGVDRAARDRDYCARTLRAVSEVVWLGPALATRVEERLGDVMADVSDVGGVLRVSLVEGETLDALEQALLPILPPPRRG